MSSEPPQRERLLSVAARRLQQGTSPYWVMTLFLFLSGAAGFLASVGLLKLGVDRMPVRYPLAVAAGYATFLALLGLWLRNQRGDGGDELSDLANAAYLADAVTPRGSRADDRPATGSGGSTDLGLGSLGSVGGDSDGCGGVIVALLVTVAVVALVFAAVWSVAMAPTLLAELLVDGLVVGSLPKRRTRHWTRTALQRTGWGALGLAVLLGLVGWGLEAVVPGAHTMGQAMGFGGAK